MGIREVVPEPVIRVCRVLKGAGHEAYTVGGAVRDAILGRVPGDWDVTTSAHPDEVNDLFRHTIPTGIAHGTVTVMVGRGRDRVGIEVTTFRGEGAYSDGRRPDEVVFGVPLREDLARRDFVINAIAYDPVDDRIEDPFDGSGDIARKLIRAVGDPVARFEEDGLRVMRAVRFVSVLGFDLEADTEEALELGLPSLAKVAAERIRVELLKLLGGPAAYAALEIARRRRVLAVALPISEQLEWPAAARRVAATPREPVLRLAALLCGDVEAATAETALHALKVSNVDRRRVVGALEFQAFDRPTEAAELRPHLGRAGRATSADLAALWRSRGDGELAALATEILDRGDPLISSELALGGGDIMRLLGIEPGPVIGRIIERLVAVVHADPKANAPEELAARLPAIYAEVSASR